MTIRTALTAAITLVLAGGVLSRLPAGHPHPHRADPEHGWAEDTVFTLTEVRPGVYFAVGRTGYIVGANSVVIVTDRDVILVDDHITPRAARALMTEVRRLTPKPLRYVINTHFHYDHASGNQIFGPEVELVAHPATRAALLAGPAGAASVSAQIAATERNLAAARARRDTTRSDSARAALGTQIATWDQYLGDLRGVVLTMPTLTVDSSLVLFRGADQEIRVFWMGRGHTEGDVVVHLPREGLLVTGDLMTNTAGLPFMADGYPGEWGATLRRLAGLSFTTTLPGHGQPFDGTARYGAMADVMDDVWRQALSLAPSVPADEAPEAMARRFDVSRYAAAFPALRNGLPAVGARRALDLAGGRVR